MRIPEFNNETINLPAGRAANRPRLPATILVVEDNPANLKLLCNLLDFEGYRTLAAGDGREALEILRREETDAVVSDILMPNMDGYRLLYEIRRDDRLKHLPFIVYTSTYTSSADEKLAQELHADKFLRKPAPAQAIIDAVDELLNRQVSAERPPITAPADFGLIKEYSERLVAKLEDKTVELERAKDAVSDALGSLQIHVAELQETKKQNLHLLWHSPAVVYSLRLDGDELVPTSVSSNIRRVTGFEVGEALKPTWWRENIFGEDRESLRSRMPKILASESTTEEYRFYRKDGSLIWIRDALRVLHDKNGRATEIIGSWTDVTEWKKLRLEVETRERQLSSFLQRAPAGLCILDRELRYIQINETLAEINGRTVADHLGKTVVEVLPNLAPAVVPLLENVLATGQARLDCELQGETARKPGEIRHWVVSYSPIKNAAGAAEQIGIVVVEVTPLKRAQLQLHEVNERLSWLLECLPVIPFSCRAEPDYEVDYISSSVMTVTGFSPEAFINQPNFWASRIHPEDQPRVLASIPRVFETGHCHNEFRWQIADGSWRWFGSWTRLVKAAPGQPARLAGNWVDITDRKKSEQRVAAEHAVSLALSKSGGLTAGGAKFLQGICENLDWAVGLLWTVDRAANVLRCTAIWHKPSTEFLQHVNGDQRLFLPPDESVGS